MSTSSWTPELIEKYKEYGRHNFIVTLALLIVVCIFFVAILWLMLKIITIIKNNNKTIMAMLIFMFLSMITEIVYFAINLRYY